MAAYNRQEALRQSNRSDIFCTKGSGSGSLNNSFFERTTTSNFKNKSDIFNIDQSFSANRNSCIKTSSVHNRSSVFLGDEKNDSYIVKKTKFSNTEYNPDKYYNNITVYERKIREFYPDSDKYNELNRSVQTARGTLKKEIFEDSIKKRSDLGDQDLTARERKFKQNNSALSKEEVKKILSENKIDDLKTVSNSQVANGASNLSIDKADSKTKKREFLKSNIFHDPEKKEIYEKFEKMENSVVIEKENRNMTPPKVTVPLNPWEAKIDWKNPKNELIFHNDYKEFNKDENCTPLLRKIKNLQDHSGNQELNEFTSKFVPNTQDPDQVIVSEDRQQIKNSLQDKMESQLKVRRSLELSSVAQGKDFYKDNMKLFNKVDRTVSAYEVKDVKDFENLKVKEITNMFAKNG
jgi:hypothetical protein